MSNFHEGFQDEQKDKKSGILSQHNRVFPAIFSSSNALLFEKRGVKSDLFFGGKIMSMNGQFWAFSQQDIDAMIENNDLVDEFTDYDEKKYLSVLDIGDTWHIFTTMFDYPVFPNDEDIFYNDRFEFGCAIFSVNRVKECSVELSEWTREAVSAALQNFDEEDDIYHFESLKEDNGEYLLQRFDKLVAFFNEAAEKGLGAVFAVM
jgi:Domain of unknown function (DUF1877)